MAFLMKPVSFLLSNEELLLKSLTMLMSFHAPISNDDAETAQRKCLDAARWGGPPQ